MKSGWSIRTQLFLLIAVLALPLIALTARNLYLDFAASRETAGGIALRLAEVTAAETARFLRDTQSVLVGLSQRPLVRALDAQRCDPLLKELNALYPQFANVLTINLAGNPVCSAVPLPARSAATKSAPYDLRELVRTDKFTIGKPTVGFVTGKWIAVLAQPLHDEQGKLNGAVGLPVDLVNFHPLASDTGLLAGTDIRIVTGDGSVVASMRDPEIWVGKNALDIPGVGVVLARKHGVAPAAGVEGDERIYGFAPIPGTNWYAYASVPSGVAIANLREQAFQSMGVAILVVLLAVGLALFAARAVARPVRAMAKTEQDIARGERAARFAVDGPDEIAAVATRFNRVLDTLANNERRLKEDRDRLDGILNTVMEGIVSIDERQHIVIFNPGAERMFGQPAAHMLGRPLGTLIPERYRAPHEEHIRRFAATGETSRPMGKHGTIFGLRASGEEFPLEAAISRSGISRDTLLTVTLRDVSERLRAETDRKRLLDVLEASLNELYIFDPDTLRFWYVNPSALGNLGYGAEAMRAMTPLDLKPEFNAAAFRELVGSLLRGEQKAIVFQTNHRRADATLYPVEVHLQLVGEETQRAFLAVIFDITERLRAEQALRDYAGQLRQLSLRMFETEENERRRLARELHDRIGQNVTALSLNLNMMRGELPEDSRHQVKTRLDDCESLLYQTAQLVRNVLVDLRPPGLDDLGLLAALSAHARQVAERTGVAVAVTGSEIVPRLAPAAEITLFRIVQEALNNIAKHARATEVTVTLEAGPDSVVLTVADNGCGFDTTARPAQPTLSLGMVSMRERVESIGGKLRIESAPSKGTRVIVAAPRANHNASTQPDAPGIESAQDLGTWSPAKNNRKDEE
jgi:hypothetical protein